MRRALVSVIIPVFNVADYLAEALNSIKPGERYDVEKIVIDDGSNKPTASSIQQAVQNDCQSILLRHPHGKNLGVSASRLLGLKYANGDYVAFLDADDSFEERKLAAQVELLDRDVTYAFVHTAINVIGGPADRAVEVQSYFNSFDPDQDYKKVAYECKICFSSAMVRRTTLRKIMFSLPFHHQYEDWALWNALLESHQGHFLSERLTNYRIHDQSASESIRRSRGLALSALIEHYLSLTVIFRNPVRRLRALGQLVEVLWKRRRELTFGLKRLEEYRVENNYSNLLALSLSEMKYKNIVVWGYGSLGRRLLNCLRKGGVRIDIVVDKQFDGEITEAGALHLTPDAFFQLADSKKQFLILATSFYTEVIAQIKKKEIFSLDSVVVTDPACEILE